MMLSKHVFVFITLFTLFFGACKKVDIQFGEQFVDNEYTQIYKTDSFSADVYTVLVDSFITSAKGITIIGGLNDTAFGKINTKCFFEVTPPSFQAVYDSTRFDSLSLILTLNKSYYGDTTKPLQVEVSRLSEKIVLPEGETDFYNNRSFTCFPTAIGSGSFLIRPSATDTISIRLDDAIGKELLKKLQTSSDDIKTSSAFIEYFHGLRISSSSSHLLINCTDKITMRLRYRKPGLYQLEEKYVDFSLATSQHHFNNITADRSGLTNGLQNLGVNNKIIPSAQLNNQAYSQYITGVVSKIKFPTLRDILKIRNYAKILSAKLKIYPVKGSYDIYSSNTLPPALRLSITDLNNTIGSDLGFYTSNGSYVSDNGNLFIDKLYGENTVYTYDVSDYIKQLSKTVGDDKSGLLFLPPANAHVTQFPRIIFGSKNHPTSKIVLEVYYATVN